MNGSTPVSTLKPAIETLSFEAAMLELEQIVREMESGKTGLEDAIKTYERGIALKNHCQKRLADAQMRIDQITQSSDGTLALTPVTTDSP